MSEKNLLWLFTSFTYHRLLTKPFAYSEHTDLYACLILGFMPCLAYAYVINHSDPWLYLYKHPTTLMRECNIFLLQLNLNERKTKLYIIG